MLFSLSFSDLHCSVTVDLLITCGIGHFELLFKGRQVTPEQWLDIINIIMQLQAYLFDVIYVFIYFLCIALCKLPNCIELLLCYLHEMSPFW